MAKYEFNSLTMLVIDTYREVLKIYLNDIFRPRNCQVNVSQVMNWWRSNYEEKMSQQIRIFDHRFQTITIYIKSWSYFIIILKYLPSLTDHLEKAFLRLSSSVSPVNPPTNSLLLVILTPKLSLKNEQRKRLFWRHHSTCPHGISYKINSQKRRNT